MLLSSALLCPTWFEGALDVALGAPQDSYGALARKFTEPNPSSSGAMVFVSIAREDEQSRHQLSVDRESRLDRVNERSW